MKIKLKNYVLQFLYIFLIVVLLSSFCVTYYFLNTSEIVANMEVKTLSFAGTKKSEIVFLNIYADYIYDNNGKIESHLVNLEKNEEVSISEFLKNEDGFNQKILELLKKKYSEEIANKLYNEAQKSYEFTIDKLIITFTLSDEEIYTLDVIYNYINEFLYFDGNVTEIKEEDIKYDNNKVTVAFSFDDGPNKSKTVSLIDALEERGMSASFFMVGNKLYNDADTVRYVYNSHSEVGYHSYSHTSFKEQSGNVITSEFQKTDSIFNEITGGHLYLTRPPYGSYNNVTINALSTPIIRWNKDTNDWKYRDVNYIKSYVLENISDGDIILFHDSYDTSVTAAIELMDELKNKDIQVVSVTKLFQIKGISLEPHNVYYYAK